MKISLCMDYETSASRVKLPPSHTYITNIYLYKMPFVSKVPSKMYAIGFQRASF